MVTVQSLSYNLCRAEVCSNRPFAAYRFWHNLGLKWIRQAIENLSSYGSKSISVPWEHLVANGEDSSAQLCQKGSYDLARLAIKFTCRIYYVHSATMFYHFKTCWHTGQHPSAVCITSVLMREGLPSHPPMCVYQRMDSKNINSYHQHSFKQFINYKLQYFENIKYM